MKKGDEGDDDVRVLEEKNENGGEEQRLWRWRKMNRKERTEE